MLLVHVFPPLYRAPGLRRIRLPHAGRHFELVHWSADPRPQPKSAPLGLGLVAERRRVGIVAPARQFICCNAASSLVASTLKFRIVHMNHILNSYFSNAFGLQ
jgi:hypothetical protein